MKCINCLYSYGAARMPGMSDANDNKSSMTAFCRHDEDKHKDDTYGLFPFVEWECFREVKEIAKDE